MAMSKWMKQASKLANQHSDKLYAGIDSAAGKAKQKSPSKSSYIDKAASYAKKGVEKAK